jgi:hypothetical protein
MSPQLLLSYDFPPMGGGIARWMGELARRFPAESLVISTGHCPGGPGGFEVYRVSSSGAGALAPWPAAARLSLCGVATSSRRAIPRGGSEPG